MLIKNTRAASAEAGIPVALLADLQGPKVRVGLLPKEGVRLEKGSRATFRAGSETYHAGIIPVPYQGLARDLKSGDRILLDDGLIEAKVQAIKGNLITTKVVTGGVLASHKGFNVPTATLRIPAVTTKDLRDANFALRQGVDFLALSFVKTAHDLRSIRKLLDRSAKHRGVKIIVKIEKHEAVKNFDQILEAADFIMIARGDLGIEVPAEDVPILQKKMIEKCLRAAKPVIVATQMLDSMIRNPRPTRAEVSDVANAVIDHTDAVMLSGETATGKYPLEAVHTMTKIIHETEASPYDDLAITEIRDHGREEGEVFGEVTSLLSGTSNIKLIAVTTLTGRTARLIARFRPEIPIVALTREARIARQLALSWGVHSFVVPLARSLEGLLRIVRRTIRQKKLARPGSRIVIVTGEPVGHPGTVNLVKVVKL